MEITTTMIVQDDEIKVELKEQKTKFSLSRAGSETAVAGPRKMIVVDTHCFLFSVASSHLYKRVCPSGRKLQIRNASILSPFILRSSLVSLVKSGFR